MAGNPLKCPYCNAKPFKSARGLVQHQQSSRPCFQAIQRKHGAKISSKKAHTFVSFASVNDTMNPANLLANATTSRPKDKNSSPISQQHTANTDNNPRLSKRHRTSDESSCFQQEEYDADDDNGMCPLLDDVSEDSQQRPVKISATSENNAVNTEILADWQKYTCWAKQHLLPDFTKSEANAIKLLATLRKTKASLDTYESVMEWHLQSTGALKHQQTITDCKEYISRKVLFKKLRKRYNYSPEKCATIEELTLPHSKARVQIVLNDPKYVIQSLLTDPRIVDEDYIFNGKSPFSGPKPNHKHITDLHTGLAYRETYKCCISDPSKQILLPVIFYIDGANTGQFVDLPLTAVKISLGIFTRKARNKHYFWGTIGYIPSYSKHVSRGRRMVIDTGHMESIMAHPEDIDEDEGQEAENNVVKAQDLHAMLAVILRNYVKLQATGFKWDLVYQGRCYEGVEFVMFTPFLRLDSDEAEKLCGKYTARTGNVKQLCRYCECPTDECDRPLAEYPFKTPEKISALIANNDTEGLRMMSQQNIQNTMYQLRFGKHNNQGIHGACPMDMLHAILLGIFRYIRDCFFEQVGPDSKLADDINACAIEIGQCLSRQSQRDLPRTRFPNGIRKGKLNAKDFPGILLCLACVLRSNGVRTMLRKRRGHFRKQGVLKDWSLVVETLLQWEMWLKSDRMRVKHVQFARQKHRYIMYLIKRVGNRVKGMGLKITKFHCIMHIADDILHFGVPSEVDTGINESGHIEEKKCAQLTQKKKELFDQQTCKRLEEKALIDLALMDMEGLKKWEYYEYYEFSPESAKEQEQPRLGGPQMHVYYDTSAKEFCAYILRRGTGRVPVKVEQSLLDFVGGLQECVQDYCKSMPVYPNHHREGCIFRATSGFMGSAWRDWVIIDWGEEEGHLPCHIMGFVDLMALPENCGLSYGPSGDLYSGLFAIVEVTVQTEPEDDVRSELFIPYEKVVGGFTGKFVSHNVYYLADVEAFVRPCAVIPDYGAQANCYLLLKDRARWKKDFERWLEEPAEYDVMYPTENEEEPEDQSEKEQSGESTGTED